jgi:phosphonatase-like hydrolase
VTTPNGLSLFLFDMAGTTIEGDTADDNDAFRVAAASEGLTADDEFLRSTMGWFKRDVFATLLRDHRRDDDAADELVARYNAYLARIYTEHPPAALPGAEQAMAALSEAGALIGFTTGFHTEIKDILLAGLGWTPDVSVAADQVAHGRPAPDMIAEAMRRTGVTDVAAVGVAGDTPSDMRAGSSAGCRWVIGVGHGTHTLDQLAEHPHTHLIDDLTSLPAIVLGDDEAGG